MLRHGNLVFPPSWPMHHIDEIRIFSSCNGSAIESPYFIYGSVLSEQWLTGIGRHSFRK
jgi:hypothetical protein